MNKSLILALCGAGLVLGGCSLAPEYQRPEAPVPSQWPVGAAYGDKAPEAHVAADLKWQDFLSDERLQKVIDKALDNNRDLRLAILNVELARGMYGIQRGELYPSIGTQGGGGRQQRSIDLIQPGEPRTVDQYSVDLGISAAFATCQIKRCKSTSVLTNCGAVLRSPLWPKLRGYI